MTTFTILESSQKRAFLDHINSIDQHIQFTCEEQREDGSIPFLGVLIIPNEDGSLNGTVFIKPTHTDLYLQWDSHHTLPSKYSVIGTLLHRAKNICSNPQLLKQEEDHLYKALYTYKYPTWALNRIKMKIRNPTNKKNNNSNPKKLWDWHQPENHTSLFLTIEGSVKVSGKHAVTMGCRCISREVQPSKTSWWLPRTNRSGVIYRFKCDRMECDDEYIGESSRTFGERFKEHLKAPSPIFDHYNTTGHQVSIENFRIVGERSRPHESH